MRIINRKPTRLTSLALGALPFVLLVLTYAVASHFRRLENPADKLLPSLEKMGQAFWRMAFVPDRRSGDLLLWLDTYDSLWRLGTGIAVSTLLALIARRAGRLPALRAQIPVAVPGDSSRSSRRSPSCRSCSSWWAWAKPPRSLLIALGTAPVMTRSVAQAVMDLPRELIIKAQTLGASTWQMMTRVVLPQVLPKLITAMRLGLVPAWIFLISAEAIASTSGLGYRIFLVRRFLAMDVILPYVLVDHAACLSDRPAAADAVAPRLPLEPHAGGKPVSAQPKIAVHGVGKSYDGAVVLEGVSLDVEAGSFCTVVGASGCGKSTFLRMLLSQETPDRGVILLDGRTDPGRADRRPRHRVPALFGVSASERRGQSHPCRRVRKRAKAWPRLRRQAAGTMRSTVDRTLEAIGLAGSRKSYPRTAFGRHAATAGDCPGASEKARRAPDGRTLRRA
jgi:NitT/TauT family transport system permease protein